MISELQFLNKVIETSDSSLIEMNSLDNSYFPEYKKEFDFIKEHLDRYHQVPDKETFLGKFPDFKYLDVKEPNSFLLQELINDRNQRYLASSFNKVRDCIMKGDVDNAMKIYRNGIDGLKTGITLESVDILHDKSRYEEYLEKSKDFSKYFVKTGFHELDKVIGGWDRNDELATIVGRSGRGKTWCLLKSLVAAAEQGLKVGLYSGEMTASKVGYRLDTLISHLSNGAIIHGNVDIKNEYKDYIDNVASKISGSIHVLTPSMIDGPAGVKALGLFIDKEKLDILFIDQHSLLEDDKNAKNPVEKAANISKDLKNLQVMKKIPIISVSQQNRVKNEDSKGNQVIDLTLISQSDRIGQDSTTVIFIERKDDVMRLHLVKSRDSENGKVLTYRIDLNKGIFEYSPDDEDALQGDDKIEELHDRYEINNDEVGEEVF